MVYSNHDNKPCCTCGSRRYWQSDCECFMHKDVLHRTHSQTGAYVRSALTWQMVQAYWFLRGPGSIYRCHKTQRKLSPLNIYSSTNSMELPVVCPRSDWKRSAKKQKNKSMKDLTRNNRSAWLKCSEPMNERKKCCSLNNCFQRKNHPILLCILDSDRGYHKKIKP